MILSVATEKYTKIQCGHQSIKQASSSSLNNPTQPPQYIPHAHALTLVPDRSLLSLPLPPLQYLRTHPQHIISQAIRSVLIRPQNMHVIRKPIDFEFEVLRDLLQAGGGGACE